MERLLSHLVRFGYLSSPADDRPWDGFALETGRWLPVGATRI
jgi:hypothetical protein